MTLTEERCHEAAASLTDFSFNLSLIQVLDLRPADRSRKYSTGSAVPVIRQITSTCASPSSGPAGLSAEGKTSLTSLLQVRSDPLETFKQAWFFPGFGS